MYMNTIHTRLTFIILSLTFAVLHSIAQNCARIVQDRQARVWYTDNQHLWLYDSNGQAKPVIPNLLPRLLYLTPQGTLAGLSEGNDAVKGHYYYHWELNNDTILISLGDTIFADASTATFTIDTQGNRYTYLPGNPGAFVLKKPNGQDSVLATSSLPAVGNLYMGPKNMLFFTSADNLYCIPPDEPIATVAENLADTASAAPRLPLLRAIWNDNKKNLYVATGSIIRKIDHRKLVTTIYQSAGNWFPADGMVTANGDFYVLEYNTSGAARVNKISMAERKAMVAAQKWRIYYLPLLLALAVMVLLYFLFRPAKK